MGQKGTLNDLAWFRLSGQKLPPAITCPNPMLQRIVELIHPNLTLLGRATATNICSNTTITYRNDTLTMEWFSD